MKRRMTVDADGTGEVPVACSQGAALLGEREAQWRSLLDTSLVLAERIPSGVRIGVQPSRAAELQRLIALERACCPWMRFQLEAPATVAITASGAGAGVLVAMFLDRDPTRPGPLGTS